MTGDRGVRTGMRSAWQAVRGFWAVQAELQERLVLLDRPWERELLHWSGGALTLSRRGARDRRRTRATRRPAW